MQVITFAILGFIGAKMIWDALHEEAEKDEEFAQEGSSGNSVHSGQILTLPVLTLQAIATSIDALAVGVSFAALSVNVAFAAGTIALTTALTCGIALVVGKRFGNALGERATIIGGIVLILIGLKSLLF